MEDLNLKQRVLDIAYKNKLSHLGSYFSSLGIIDNIYAAMDLDNDIFILSSGHAAVALYAVIEKYYDLDAGELFARYGGHPHRSEKDKIFCSTGSLGMGLTVAVGRAVANPRQKVYCLISDGECAEGSIWEALRYIHENRLDNIEVYANINGYAAYDAVDVDYLSLRLRAFLPRINLVYTSVNTFPFLRGLNAHYHVMSEEDYMTATRELKS
tara:strand:+ start:66 stop:701 length:636 start_codon:yes stop_codon:yes gene_type:complete